MHEVEFWDAFRFLSKFRRYENGGPIPFSLEDCKTYCEYVGIDNAAKRLEIADMILAMDSEWFDFQRDKAKLDAKNEQRRRDREKVKK